jgi:deoxyribodipyrimidine photo-lyase
MPHPTDQPDLFGAPERAPPLKSWTPTRAAGLERLAAFVPHAGRAYAASRNADRGPDDRSNVSALSPWLRRRLITEEEVIAATLKHHSAVAAEKFIQEVCWRTYWKGWLQMRPEVLVRFNDERIALNQSLDKHPSMARRLAAAKAGTTGIECFDAWVDELTTTGWLHNHARMWFASIWVFTLNLPWQLGSDFFYKHLLDADPASNTLSWRWVAGLHTPGKHYLARAENIARFTSGRFDPRGQLNERAAALIEHAPPLALTPLAAPGTLPEGRFGLLIHDDDLEVASWCPPERVSSLAGFDTPVASPADSLTGAFRRNAFDDGLQRAAAWCGCESFGLLNHESLLNWAIDQKTIVTPEAPVGLTGWALDRLERDLASRGCHLIRIRRDWDTKAWPQARAGFFKLKEKIPQLIAHLGQSNARSM